MIGGDGCTVSGLPPPAETELAARCGVSRGTIRQAVAALTAEGLIGSRQGSRRGSLGHDRAPVEGLIGSYQGIRHAVDGGPPPA